MPADGILYASYNTIDEFKGLLRMHLSGEVRAFMRAGAPLSRATAPTDIAVGQSDAAVTEVDDEGFLDLVERGADRIQEANETLETLNEATAALGRNVTAIAQEVQASPGAPSISPSIARRQVDRAAGELARYAERLEFAAPVLGAAYSESMGVFGRAAAMMVELQDDAAKSREALQVSLATVREAVSAVGSAREGLVVLRSGIAGLPRLSTALNRSKRRALAAVDALASALETAMQHGNEAARVLDNMMSE